MSYIEKIIELHDTYGVTQEQLSIIKEKIWDEMYKKSSKGHIPFLIGKHLNSLGCIGTFVRYVIKNEIPLSDIINGIDPIEFFNHFSNNLNFYSTYRLAKGLEKLLEEYNEMHECGAKSYEIIGTDEEGCFKYCYWWEFQYNKDFKSDNIELFVKRWIQPYKDIINS